MTYYFPIPLSVDKLMAEARRITNIDIIDDALIKPFTVFHKSLSEEGMMHKQGAQDMVPFILRMLSNRLRMLRDFATYPEITEQEIKAPIFIWGAMRTGSTKTQKLLAASDDFNWLPFWQALNPSLHTGDRNESPQARIDDAAAFTQFVDEKAPNMKYIHHMKPHQPDEETFFLINTFLTSSLMGVVKVPSYLQWLMTQDMTKQFEFLRDTLKYLQWQGLANPEKRWILKSPFYYGLEPQLLEIFPDASMVMTHRNPSATFPSTCSMLMNMHLPFSDAPIDFQELLSTMVFGIETHLKIREAYPNIDILDINYTEITQSVDALIDRIYIFCNEPLKDTSRQRIHAWNNSNPIHKKGMHKYTLEDFGISKEQLTQQYSNYTCFLENTFQQ